MAPACVCGDVTCRCVYPGDRTGPPTDHDQMKDDVRTTAGGVYAMNRSQMDLPARQYVPTTRACSNVSKQHVESNEVGRRFFQQSRMLRRHCCRFFSNKSKEFPIFRQSSICLLLRHVADVHRSLRSIAHRTAHKGCLLYTSPSPRDRQKSRMPSSA